MSNKVPSLQLFIWFTFEQSTDPPPTSEDIIEKLNEGFRELKEIKDIFQTVSQLSDILDSIFPSPKVDEQTDNTCLNLLCNLWMSSCF